MPMTIDFRSYSVCHSKDLYLENLTFYYHHYSNHRTCFLIEHLGGGPWWSYITHEFAEILAFLEEIGIQSGVNYRPFPNDTKFDTETNLTKYFLNECNFDEHLYLENKIPIIILLWDIDRLLWHKMHRQWVYLFQKLRIRLLVFIDDLHFITQATFSSRQYMFESVASEIFSTYPYIFHNYYYNIPSSRLTWLPHAASTLVDRSINFSAEYRLLISGSRAPEWYPCREHGFFLCRNVKRLTACLPHPSYKRLRKNPQRFHHGERYFSYIKRYVFGLATCTSVHYTIAKLFEFPANGLVLVTTSDLIPILERLHLYHHEHFLTVKCSSLDELLLETVRLQDIPKDQINIMRLKSQQVVSERHLTRHRAELLHVRLLAQALILISSSDTNPKRWEQWGRYCD